MFTAKRKGFLAFFAALILASLIGLGLIFIPDNTRALAANAEDGTTTETDATTPDSSHVAQVGETGYDTLQEAINAAGDATVKLLSDVNENVTVAEDKDITLDLNGYTLTNVEAHTIINQGILTVVDNSAEKDGTVDNITHAKAAFYNYGTAYLKGGIFTRSLEAGTCEPYSGNGNSFYTIKNSGELYIEEETTVTTRMEINSDGVMTGGYSSLISNGYNSQTDFDDYVVKGMGQEFPELFINGGTISGGLNTIKNGNYGILSINGGELKNSVQNVLLNWNKATITGGTFTAEGDNVAAVVTGGKVGSEDACGTTTISGGTFNGAIAAVAEYAETIDYTVSGGEFKEALNPDYVSDSALLYPELNEDGAVVYKAAEGTEVPENSVGTARIGNAVYRTLAEAVLYVPVDNTETRITVIGGKDGVVDGAGVQVLEGMNIVIDFSGLKYNLIEPTVGSPGTETNGFQLLKGSTVTMKNGSIVSDVALILIQNYCNLTLDNMILDLSGYDQVKYVISNNFGNTVITGNTEIVAPEEGVAFDVYYGLSSAYYDGVNVTFDEKFTGTVNGKVEYGVNYAQENWQQKAQLNIKNGTFNVDFTVAGTSSKDAGINVSGGEFIKDVNADFIADDSLLYPADNGTYSVGKYEEVIEKALESEKVAVIFGNKAYESDEDAVKAGVVAKIGKTGYATLQEAVDSITSAEQTEIVLLDDITATSTPMIVKKDCNIKLNLNGHDLVAQNTYVISFNMAVKDATLTIVGSGSISCGGFALIYAEFCDESVHININENGKDDGTIISAANQFIAFSSWSGDKSALNIYGGEFVSGKISSNSPVNIYGGKFGEDVSVVSVGGGAIYGGTFGQSAVANAVADGYVFYPDSEDSYAVVAEEDFAINEYCRVQVGENTYYTSLEEAIENVRSGGVITVLQDITMSHAVACGVQNVTLDLNGKTVTIPESFDDKFVVTADKTRAGVAIRVQDSGSLTLKDSSEEQTGKFDATNAADSVNVLSAENATITMVSGTIVVDTNAEACLFAFEGGTIIIEGGTLINECTENYVYGGGAPLVVNINNSTTGKIVVNGGTFTGRNPALGDDSDGGTFLDADAKIAKTADGNFVAYVNDADKPADATDIYYVEDGVVIFEVAALDGFYDGFYKAIEDGATYIRLGNDFNNLTNVIVIKNEELTIDLNGHSINGSIAGVATGENGNGKELLFLIDSNINIINTADTEGVIAVNDGNTTSKTIYYDAIYAERTNLTIENVTIQSLNNDGEGIAFLGEYGNDEISSNYENTSTFYTLNIIDSKILGYAQAIIGNGALHGTIINIENSEITATDGWAIYHPQYGILNVKGTNTTITGGTAIEMRAGILNVEAGTITATAAFEIGKKEDAASGTSMMGVAVAVSQHTTNLDTQVNISGGTLNATDANGKAVYEEDIMDDQSENIALNLTGGTFNAPVESKNEINYISGGSYLVKPADNAFATSYAGELYNGYYIVVEKEDASAGESGVTITERLNAQTDVRTYMAAFGLRLSEMQTLAETDSGAAAIIGAYNGILGASAPQALAEAKAAALDAVDKFIDALNAAKEQAITALTEYSVGTDFSIVVVPTYAISAINQATSAAEIELYVASAKAEMDDIRAQRAAATEEAEQLAGIIEALEIVKGEEGWNSSLIDDISGNIDAIMGLIGTAADTSSNETLFGLIQKTSEEITQTITSFSQSAQNKLDSIISKVDALPDYSGEFTELNNAIAQVQTAANAANDSLATMSPTVDSINTTVVAMQKVQDELKKTFEEFCTTFDSWTDDMTGRFDALDKAIAALPDNTAAIEELNKLLTEAQKGIDAANESIGKLDTAVGDQLDGIEAKVDVVDGVTDSVLAAQKALETAVAGYKTAADEALAEIKTSLEGVAEDVTALAADVAADKAALSAEIAKLQATADKLEDAVAALDGDSQADLTSISEKLAALQSAVDGVKADVNKVSQSVDTVSDENKNSASSFAGIYTFLSVLVVLVIAVMIITAIKKRRN